MKDFKGQELNIGDTVVFTYENILAEGTITKFYSSRFENHEACSINVYFKEISREIIVRNIYSKRILKVN